MDDILWQVGTPFDYSAILRRQNWERHADRHPELEGYLPDIPSLLSDPDLVIEADDGAHHYYRYGLGRGKVATCYLHAVVREFGTDDAGTRTVTSAFFTHVFKKGVLIWQRTS